MLNNKRSGLKRYLAKSLVAEIAPGRLYSDTSALRQALEGLRNKDPSHTREAMYFMTERTASGSYYKDWQRSPIGDREEVLKWVRIGQSHLLFLECRPLTLLQVVEILAAQLQVKEREEGADRA